MFTPFAVVLAVNAAVNASMRPCADARAQRAACSTDYRPDPSGDCKQAVALKLRQLIRLGAEPREFTIWIVRVPGAPTPHAVLVQNATGLVLDSLIGAVEPRAFKERHEGYSFLKPCEPCGDAAREDAARVPPYEGAR